MNFNRAPLRCDRGQQGAFDRKAEPGLYAAAVRTFIRLVTKRRVRRAEAHTACGEWTAARDGKRQISSTHLAACKDWCRHFEEECEEV
jgi:hypothetical protein